MPCKARLRNKEPEIQDPGGEGTASFAGIIACGGSCRPPPPRFQGASRPAAAPLGAHGDQEGRDGRRKSNGKKGGKARAL